MEWEKEWVVQGGLEFIHAIKRISNGLSPLLLT
jgi:hypothetical protein